MINATCLTILIFKDGKKKVKRTLDGSIHLQEKNIISLPNPIDDSFYGGIPTRSTPIDKKIREGIYEVQKVNRSYSESDTGFLKIEYSLLRVDK